MYRWNNWQTGKLFFFLPILSFFSIDLNLASDKYIALPLSYLGIIFAKAINLFVILDLRRLHYQALVFSNTNLSFTPLLIL